MTRAAGVEVALLACWLGAGIIVAAAVAPAAFRVLPSRTLAGAVVGEVLPVIFISGLVVAGLALVLEMRSGQGVRTFAMAAFAAMIIGCGVAQFVITPRIDSLRASFAGPVESLDKSDPRRIQFGKLHAFSVMWMGVAMLGAGSAIGRKLYFPSG